MNKISWGILLFLILALVGMGYFWGLNTSARKNMKIIEIIYKQKLDEHTKTIALLENNMMRYEEEVIKYDGEIEKLKREAKKNREELAKAKKKIEEAPPEHLVKETQRILNTNEIWLAGTRIEFSLTAFKSNTIKLIEWENFILFQGPAYEKEDQIKEDLIAKLKVEITTLKEINKAQKDKYTLLENLNKDWKDYIRKQQRRSVITTVLQISGGVAAGYMVGSLLGK